MREFFEQVARGGDGPFSYLALAGALIVPDICGAMESGDGRAEREWHIKWYDEHAPTSDLFDGARCYMLRCSFLHQGTTVHPHSSYSRIVFVEPNPQEIVLHMNVLADALNIAIREFCREVAGAALRWLNHAEQQPAFQRNFGRFLQRYPDGFPPYIVGLPVVT